MLSVEIHCINVFSLTQSIFFAFFRQIKTQKNVHIRNELNFSDIYRIINDIGSLAKVTWIPSGLTYFARDPV